MTDFEQRQKEQAIKIMEKLFKYKPIINRFRKSNIVMFSEGPFGASYDADNEPKLMKAIKELKEKNYLPFHATHEIVEGMEMWTVLVVSPYDEDWNLDLEDAEHGIVFCWVENVDEPDYSEFGSCAFRSSAAGDIKRI